MATSSSKAQRVKAELQSMIEAGLRERKHVFW